MKITNEQLKQIIQEEIEAVLDERCQKGYVTHKTQKTKKMFGRTYRNCVKPKKKKRKVKEEQELEEITTLDQQELEEKTDGKGAKDYSKDSGLKLKQWFDKGGWVQTGGKYDGKPCAKQPGQKTKPYCRDPDDRAKMSKKERDKRAAKKRKKDPNPNRKGKAKNVSQKDGRKKK